MTRSFKQAIQYSALATCIALSACVTTPPGSSLQDARAAVNTAEADPAVAKFDPINLATAQKHLADAESAADHGSQALVEHESYLAIRVARLSEVHADEVVAEERVAAADADRTRVQLAARTAEAAQANNTANAAVAAADAADQQAAQAAITVRELQAQLAGLTMRQTPRGPMLVLTDDYFEPGRPQLTPGADKILDGLAHFLVTHPERRVRVEGPLRRAEAVRMGLIARGVDPVRSEAVAYGPDSPVAPDDNSGNRSFSHGVEILVSDSTGQIASR